MLSNKENREGKEEDSIEEGEEEREGEKGSTATLTSSYLSLLLFFSSTIFFINSIGLASILGRVISLSKNNNTTSTFIKRKLLSLLISLFK